MIDSDDIRTRYRQACKFLDERGRRLFAANEALAIGPGGVTAASAAAGLARSTIRRAIVELQSGVNPVGTRVRRKGGGRKRAVVLQPELPTALEALIEDAIRGDPETPLRWVSRSQRQIVRALLDRGFEVSQKLSRRPKVLQQALQPEPLRGHASLAAGLLWRQRQEPFSCIVGQGVDGLGLPIGRHEAFELAPKLIHWAQFGCLLGQPQEPDAQLSG